MISARGGLAVRGGSLMGIMTKAPDLQEAPAEMTRASKVSGCLVGYTYLYIPFTFPQLTSSVAITSVPTEMEEKYQPGRTTLLSEPNWNSSCTS